MVLAANDPILRDNRCIKIWTDSSCSFQSAEAPSRRRLWGKKGSSRAGGSYSWSLSCVVHRVSDLPRATRMETKKARNWKSNLFLHRRGLCELVYGIRLWIGLLVIVSVFVFLEKWFKDLRTVIRSRLESETTLGDGDYSESGNIWIIIISDT